jgi:uncharacterized protein YjbJ (UPF0337 family)
MKFAPGGSSVSIGAGWPPDMPMRCESHAIARGLCNLAAATPLQVGGRLRRVASFDDCAHACCAVTYMLMTGPFGTCGRSGSQRGISMNKDQVKGAVKEAAGKLQQKTGKVLGNKTQETKGLATKIEGKAQKKVGDAKEALKDARSKL